MDEDAGAGADRVMVGAQFPSEAARDLWASAVALNRAAAAVSPAAAGLPPLLFFTDPDRSPRPWETARRLPAGSAVVFRAFGRVDAVDIGRRLREATRAAGARLLVGRDAGLAEAIEADGLHLPESEAGQAAAVRARRPDWLVTAAWHGEAAAPTGAHAFVLSPVFSAGGASAARPPLGIERFTALAAGAGAPVYALGGVDAETAARLARSGACGLAAIDGVQAAFDVRI